MSDPLAGLRAAVRESVEPAALAERVPFDQLAERARRYRRRRRRTAAATAVAVLGAGLLLTLPGTRRGTPILPAIPRPGPTLIVQSLAFASAQDGYAIVLRCNSPDYRCATHPGLLRTGDGARSWTPVRSPADNGTQASVELATRSGGVVLQVGATRYASPDRGRTWSALPQRLGQGPPVDQIPDGWSLDVDSAGQAVATDLMAYREHRLTHQPPGGHRTDDWWGAAARDGRLVLARVVGHTYHLDYTDDRGRTWTSIPPPPGSPGDITRLLATTSTERIYLAEADSSGRLTTIWRLDHPAGGRWVQVPVWPDLAHDPMPGNFKVLQMLPDGELAYLANPPIRTQDGGQTFVLMSDVDVYGTRAPLEYLNQSVDGQLYLTLPAGLRAPPGLVAVLASTDAGRTWQLRQFRL